MRILFVSLLSLAACTSSSVVQTQGGSAFVVDCGGPFSSKLACNERANQMCPSGFNPISSPVGQLVFTCSKRPVPASAPI